MVIIQILLVLLADSLVCDFNKTQTGSTNTVRVFFKTILFSYKEY